MPKTCPHCKSSELDVDPSRGDTVCMNCGSVLEENTIVSEVSFVANSDGSSSMVGQFVSGEGKMSLGLYMKFQVDNLYNVIFQAQISHIFRDSGTIWGRNLVK